MVEQGVVGVVKRALEAEVVESEVDSEELDTDLVEAGCGVLAAVAQSQTDGDTAEEALHLMITRRPALFGGAERGVDVALTLTAQRLPGENGFSDLEGGCSGPSIPGRFSPRPPGTGLASPTRPSVSCVGRRRRIR